MRIQEKLIGLTPQERLRFLYRVIERLRLQHNARGADYRNGVLTDAQWKTYLSTFEAKTQLIFRYINAIKENLNLFAEANHTTAKTVKQQGLNDTSFDAGIDVDNLQE